MWALSCPELSFELLPEELAAELAEPPLPLWHELPLLLLWQLQLRQDALPPDALPPRD